MDPITQVEKKGGYLERRAAGLAAAGTAAPALQGTGSVAFLASGIGPKIVFAPEGISGIADVGGDGKGDGGAGDGGDKGGSGGDGKGAEWKEYVPDSTKTADENAALKTAHDKTKPAAKPVRPDWLPENLWDADKGFKKDDVDALIAAKAERDSALASVPETADKYEVKLPATFKMPEGFELPEGEKLIDENDPRIATLREVAHAKKWTQADFEDVIAMGVNLDIAERGRLKEAVTAERDKLGTRAKERVTAVTSWLDAKLGAELGGTLHGMMFTAKQIEAFERLMQLNRGDVPGKPGAGRDGKPGAISDEEYEKMSPTARINYAREHSARR